MVNSTPAAGPTVADELPRNAADVRTWLARLYGVDPGTESGVLHVCSSVRVGDRRHVIRITADAPRSATDFFVLNVARARADAIITTGSILRAEPHMTHALQGPAQVPQALSDYRSQLGKQQPPVSVLMTRSASLQLEHPFFQAGTPVWIWTSDAAAGGFGELPSHVTVHSAPTADLRGLLRALRRAGHETISLEAGPSVAGGLYEVPSGVDELCLSEYQGRPLEAALVGGALPTDEALFAGLSPGSRAYKAEESSGPWTFQRWRR